MTDWKWYFQVRESLAERRHSDKLNVELALSLRPRSEEDCESMDWALATFKHMASSTVFVVSASYNHTKQFTHRARLNIWNVRHVSDVHCIMGLEGATVVYLGEWDRNPENREINLVLRMRRDLDIWNIKEW